MQGKPFSETFQAMLEYICINCTIVLTQRIAFRSFQERILGLYAASGGAGFSYLPQSYFKVTFKSEEETDPFPSLYMKSEMHDCYAVLIKRVLLEEGGTLKGRPPTTVKEHFPTQPCLQYVL